MDASTLARIESQRIDLEANISKLRKALRHWQTLEIDYEGLREEFLGIPEDSTAEECLKAAKESKPELVSETELRELLSENGSRSRRPAQLVELFSKRVDYVVQNIETIRKQLSSAEKKRNALLLAEEPDHRDEAGLPLQEIVEELDEAGQVISSKVQTPGSDTSQLIEVLRKAGVKDLEVTNRPTTSDTSSKEVNRDVSDSDSDDAGDLSLRPHDDANTDRNASTDQLLTNPDDTPEEAELRREMLEYSRGLDEIGAIVAELELEEQGSDASYDEDDIDLDAESDLGEEDDLEEESEDESGKSKQSLSLSRGYQKRMEELQEKLGLKNLGPEPGAEGAVDQTRKEPRPSAAEAARKAAIARNDESKKSNLKKITKKPLEDDDSASGKSGKKKVAFSSELDIAAETPVSTSSRVISEGQEQSKTRPINESVIERDFDQDNAESSDIVAPVPKAVKPSRFKAARQTQPQTPMFAAPMTLPSSNTEGQKSTPQPPLKTISADLVEREPTEAPKAPDPDDFSDEAQRKEIAMEYQQHRIKRVLGQEGGFLGSSEEGEITPLEDEETGRRVSRFKAARVKR